MNDAVWLKLAKRANELLAMPDVDGIVVTHGTDTMEETGFFLDLVVKSDKPVVLVGSMRPATSTSADGPLNLYNAVATAADPKARGSASGGLQRRPVLGARHPEDQHHRPADLRCPRTAASSARRTTARPSTSGVADHPHTTRSEFSLDGVTALPRVDIVYAHENGDAVMVNAAVAAGAQGIVLAGVGDGNATKAMVDALAAAAAKGVVVVRSTRVGSGSCAATSSSNDDKLGFVAAMELTRRRRESCSAMALTKTKDIKGDPTDVRGVLRLEGAPRPAAAPRRLSVAIGCRSKSARRSPPCRSERWRLPSDSVAGQ